MFSALLCISGILAASRLVEREAAYFSPLLFQILPISPWQLRQITHCRHQMVYLLQIAYPESSKLSMITYISNDRHPCDPTRGIRSFKCNVRSTVKSRPWRLVCRIILAAKRIQFTNSRAQMPRAINHRIYLMTTSFRHATLTSRRRRWQRSAFKLMDSDIHFRFFNLFSP